MAQPPAEVSERLLTAWRGKILAGTVYGLITRRLELSEADILRRMAMLRAAASAGWAARRPCRPARRADGQASARDAPDARHRGVQRGPWRGGDPVQASLAAGISTGVGAIIPVIPYMITTGTMRSFAAAAISLVAHFLVGAAKSLVTLRTWWSAGLEMTLQA